MSRRPAASIQQQCPLRERQNSGKTGEPLLLERARLEELLHQIVVPLAVDLDLRRGAKIERFDQVPFFF